MTRSLKLEEVEDFYLFDQPSTMARKGPRSQAPSSMAERSKEARYQPTVTEGSDEEGDHAMHGVDASEPLSEPLSRSRGNGTAVHDNDQLFTPDSNGGDGAVKSTFFDVDKKLTAIDNEDDLHTLGLHSRKLIQTIQKLETLQIKSTLPSLPKFIVVGDQSAGKSSIIEAVCDLTLPRNQGTCTRCPFQITTSASRTNEGWSCTVSLQHMYIREPSSRGKGVEFDRWSLQAAAETCEFATVHDKRQLGDVLKRAQLAILNPADPPTAYAPPAMLKRQTTQVSFSPNLICLDVRGPGLPELSFYDLPGSINVVEDEREQHLVKFVEVLVKSYLRDAQALVMLACSADQDVENSTTFRFIRDCKAERRCLGVLTKPDLLPSNTRLDYVQRMLEGKAFRLGEPWFITKQLSQTELQKGVSHGQAREREREFFSQGVWSDELSAFSGQFGIPNLQATISKQLTQHILSGLPEIIERVNSRLEDVNAQLSQFKEKDAHPVVTVLDVISDVSASVNRHIGGKNERVAFMPEYRSLLRGFRKQLRDRTPEVEAKTPGYQPKALSISIDTSEDERMPPPATPTPASSKRRANGTPARNSSTPRYAKRMKADAPDSSAQFGKVFKLDEVECEYRLNADSGLPDQQSPIVTDILIKQALTGWETVLKEFLKQIDDLVKQMISSVADHQLQRYERTALYQSAHEVLQNFLTKLLTHECREVNAILAREMHKPITLAPIASYRDVTGPAVRKQRLEQRGREYFDDMEALGGKPVNEPERKKRLADEHFVQTVLGPDLHEFAVNALVDPIAYYQVAMSRFADTVALHLEHDLLHRINTDLKQVLIAELRAADPEVCAGLLTEDPEREREREKLLCEKEKLLQAMGELNELPSLASE